MHNLHMYKCKWIRITMRVCAPLAQLAQNRVQVGFLAKQSQKIHLHTCTYYVGMRKCASAYVRRTK